MCRDPFPGQKVKVAPVIWKESQSDFLPCSPHDSILIWLNHIISGIHTTHEVTRCRAPFSRSKVKGRSNFFYHVLSVAPSLFHRFSSYDIHTTHEVTMCRAQFPGRNVKGQGHTDDLKCSLHGFLLIWPNHVICVIHTTYEEAMCRAPFSGWKVKGQGHTGHFKCYLIDMYHRGNP